MESSNDGKNEQIEFFNMGTKFEGVKGENGAKNSIKVVGGQLVFPVLNAELFKDQEEFVRRKISVWQRMLLDRQRPRKWFKATKKGTKVNFDYMYEQSEADEAVAEFKAYVEQVNEEWKLGFKKVGD